ncbi:DUF4254 domain-containing protein [Streptomyces triculaminicus]|uniref:DUF4254 domain-containing protein n=1 Tax=Streptomyces triculaminicus TaxID=2816232 RepID=UPI0037D744E8
MTVLAEPMQLPAALRDIVDGLADKDRQRLTDALERLHHVNALLWQAEDRVRAPGAPPQRIADAKREIDQLNAERNTWAERADEVLGTLTAGDQTVPMHTETLASALDRLSVLLLRIQHTGNAASNADLARRMPALHQQLGDLNAAIDTLVHDVTAGRRRLPVPARYKLYGTSHPSSAPVRPHPSITRVVAFGGLSECGKSTSAQFLADACSAQRLKIGYMLRQAAHRQGLYVFEVRGPPHRLTFLVSHQFHRLSVQTAVPAERPGESVLGLCAGQSLRRDDEEVVPRVVGDPIVVLELGEDGLEFLLGGRIELEQVNVLLQVGGQRHLGSHHDERLSADSALERFTQVPQRPDDFGLVAQEVVQVQEDEHGGALVCAYGLQRVPGVDGVRQEPAGLIAQSASDPPGVQRPAVADQSAVLLETPLDLLQQPGLLVGAHMEQGVAGVDEDLCGAHQR